MDNYVIPTIHNLHLMDYGKGNRYYCLANFYKKYNHYREFFLNLRKDKSVFITLDNGCAEGDMISPDMLLDITEELQPNEVIPSDVLFDRKQTLNNFYSFIDKLDLNCSIFGCPQGDTKDEWVKCYNEMMEHPRCNVLGLSKITVPVCFGSVSKQHKDEQIKESRNNCIDYLYKNDLIKKQLHFLGMGDPTEYLYYSQEKFNNVKHLFRSTDSCYTILAGYNNVVFEDCNVIPRIPTDNSFYTKKLDIHQENNSIKNVNYLINIINNI